MFANLGLKINLEETEALYQLPLGCHDNGQDIKEVKVLAQVNKFKYLGSTVTNNKRTNVERGTLMSNSSKAFDGLRKQD